MAIWGVAIVVIKYTLQFIDPVSFLFYRFCLTSAILFPFFLFYVKKHPLPLNKIPRLLFLGTLSTTVCLLFLFIGIQYTTAIDVSLISILGPILIVFGGAYFLKEKVTKRERTGLSIAVLGTLITVLEPVIKKESYPAPALWGNFLVFASYLSWTAYTLLWKVDCKKYHPLVITSFNFFSGLITLAPIFIIKTLNLQLTTFNLQNALPGLLYMSLASSVVAYLTYNWGISLIEASEATVFEYIKPLFAAPLAVLYLKEQVTPVFVLGAIIITLGVFLAEYKPRPGLK